MSIQNVSVGVFVLVIILGLWAIGTAVGMIPPANLPRKWSSDYYDRVAYLEGQISKNKDVAAEKELAELLVKGGRDARVYWTIIPGLIAVIILALALRG